MCSLFLLALLADVVRPDGMASVALDPVFFLTLLAQCELVVTTAIFARHHYNREK